MRSVQRMSALAKKESFDSSGFCWHLKSARSAASYFRCRLTFPQCPPRISTRRCPFWVPVSTSRRCNWSFWNAAPEEFRINRVASSFSFELGQISVGISTFWAYWSKSVSDGLNDGTSEDRWFGMPVSMVALARQHRLAGTQAIRIFRHVLFNVKMVALPKQGGLTFQRTAQLFPTSDAACLCSSKCLERTTPYRPDSESTKDTLSTAKREWWLDPKLLPSGWPQPKDLRTPMCFWNLETTHWTCCVDMHNPNWKVILGWLENHNIYIYIYIYIGPIFGPSCASMALSQPILADLEGYLGPSGRHLGPVCRQHCPIQRLYAQHDPIFGAKQNWKNTRF